jgi:predicted metal-dependent phosphoesterase TrpH
MRADLHVHSWHSGYNHDLPFLRSRDCYADPVAVYRAAKARGMDFVTITDHDSIDGCLEVLDRLPGVDDFLMGEEVSCRLPGSGVEVHFGVWGLTEAIHRDLQPLRDNAFDVAAFLRGAGVLFSFNHPLHFYRGQLPLDDYLRLVEAAPAVETRNGAMLAAHNDFAERLAVAGSRAAVGGSDAHTLRRVGCTWTEAPGRTPAEFVAAVAAGQSRAGGAQGGTLPLAADIYGVIAQYWLSLVGLQRHEIGWARRSLGLAFSITTAPFEFIPLIIAARQKQREAHWVDACARELRASSVRGPAYPRPDRLRQGYGGPPKRAKAEARGLQG